jgi:hypothetical protein
MAPVIGIVFGVICGLFVAKRRGGSGLDLVQYAGAFAIIFGLIGLFIAIFLARSATG